MLKSSLCDYSDAYALVKETLSIAAEVGDKPSNANKKVVYLKVVLHLLIA